MIAEVIINSTAKKLNRVFDYNIPKELEDYILIGSKVLVPFANFKKLEEAYVIGIKEKSAYKVKDICKVKDTLTDSQIKLAKWIAKKYFCNVSDCIKLMLTPGTRTKNLQNRITDKVINVVYLKKEKEKVETEIENNIIKSDKQKKVLQFVMANAGCTIPEIEMFTECTRGVVNTLVKNEYLQICEKKIDRNPLILKNIEKTEKLSLSEEQQKAYDKINASIEKTEFKEFLIFGVTGSRKNRSIYAVNRTSNKK